MTVAPHLPDPVTGLLVAAPPDGVDRPVGAAAPRRRRARLRRRGRDGRRPAALGARSATPGCAAGWRRSAAWIERARADGDGRRPVVEVCLLARLHGVPVVALTAPGRRTDAAHRLGFGSATALVGAWPAGWTDRLLPGLRRRHRRPRARRRRRLPVRASAPRRQPYAAPPHAVLLAGTGGDGFTRDVHRAGAGADPRLGLDGAEPHPRDLAPRPRGRAGRPPTSRSSTRARTRWPRSPRCGVPAIVVPAARPFDEQHVTAAALADGWPAVVVGRRAHHRLARPARRGAPPRRRGLVRVVRRRRADPRSPRVVERRRRRRARGMSDPPSSPSSTAGTTTSPGSGPRSPRRTAGPTTTSSSPMDDPVVAAADWCTAVRRRRHPLGLPLAAARNRGARRRSTAAPTCWSSSTSTASPDADLVEAYADVGRATSRAPSGRARSPTSTRRPPTATT